MGTRYVDEDGSDLATGAVHPTDAAEPRSASGGLTLAEVLGTLGPAIVSTSSDVDRVRRPVRTVSLWDADDLDEAAAGPGWSDLVLLVGVPAAAATAWVESLGGLEPDRRPVAVVGKHVSTQLEDAGRSVDVAVVTLHAQARAETVLARVRRLLDEAAARDVGPEPVDRVEESDLYGLAQRVATLTRGLVSIEDAHAQLLAYSATDRAADELRLLSILGRRGPADHLRRLAELGVYRRLRLGSSVVEVPADEQRGWRRRMAVAIRPLGEVDERSDRATFWGTIWVQEGHQPLAADTADVLEGAAAVAARLIHRVRSAPDQEAQQVQRLLGLRAGGVDVTSVVSAFSLPTSGPSAVVGVAGLTDDLDEAVMIDLVPSLRLMAGGFVRESLVTSVAGRVYVLVPSVRPTGLEAWLSDALDRLTARFGRQLRAAVATPVPSLEDVPAARAEVDRVLDQPAGPDRVTSLTVSRTPVLLGEICELVRERPELADPRLDTLLDYDRAHRTSLADTLWHYLRSRGDVSTAATAMHVHPNTLRYRVRRCEQILTMSLDDPDAGLLLHLQLRTRRG